MKIGDTRASLGYKIPMPNAQETFPQEIPEGLMWPRTLFVNPVYSERVWGGEIFRDVVSVDELRSRSKMRWPNAERLRVHWGLKDFVNDNTWVDL